MVNIWNYLFSLFIIFWESAVFGENISDSFSICEKRLRESIICFVKVWSMYVIRSQCNLAGNWSRLLILRIYDMVKVKSTSTLFLLLLKIYCKQRKNAICGKNFIHLMYRNLNLYLHSSNVTFPADFSVLLMLLWMFMFCFW